MNKSLASLEQVKILAALIPLHLNGPVSTNHHEQIRFRMRNIWTNWLKEIVSGQCPMPNAKL